jgi:hypothetical protein
MKNSIPNTRNDSGLHTPVVNPDGSDKNFGGFDENGKPLNPTTEKFPGNESHPGNKPNYPNLHPPVKPNNDDASHE